MAIDLQSSGSTAAVLNKRLAMLPRPLSDRIRNCQCLENPQQPPQQMLGNEAVAGAAEAALKHSSNRIIDTSSGKDDGLNKCPRCGSSDIHYSLTAKALFCSYCRHTWNEENAEQAFGLDSSIVPCGSAL